MLHVVGSLLSVTHAQTTRGIVARNDADVASVVGILPFQERSHVNLLKYNSAFKYKFITLN